MTASIDLRTFEALRKSWNEIVGLRGSTRPARDDEWPRTMSGLAGARKRIIASGGWLAGPYSLMGVLDMERAEVANCRVVRWLFDPLARHGIGAAMISSLAARIGAEVVDPTAIRAEVEVARDVSRADVVLSGLEGGGAVVIEAKVDAPEGNRQAARLEEDWPEADRLVFLTVAGTHLPASAVQTDRWRSLSWEWIAESAAEALASAAEPNDARAAEARRSVVVWISGARRYLP